MISRIEYNNPQANGNFFKEYHYEMVSDYKRVEPFKKAIDMVCPGKIVLESGAGTGILSLLAAKAGAKMVYTTEIDPEMCDITLKNIRKTGFQNIKLIQKDILDLNLADIQNKKADVVIAENLSTWQIAEPEIKILNHINRNLAKKDAIRLPYQIFNYFELAQSEYIFEDLVEFRTRYFQFSGIMAPKILSGKILFNKIDLKDINPLRIIDSIEVIVEKDGVLNSLRLTSPIKIYEDIFFEYSDSLAPPVIIPLRNDLRVNSGDRLNVQIQYESSSKWENFICNIKKLD